jgi:adenosylhomocysteine nucleosidase
MDFPEGVSTPLAIPDPDGIAEKLSARIRLLKGSVITLSHRTEKSKITEILPPGLPYAVCDMETYSAAKFCLGKDVPFFALRAITDTLEEEIPPELFTVTDEFGKYELSRALGTILTRPHLVPHVIRLGRNSETAAALLYACVKLVVEML